MPVIQAFDARHPELNIAADKVAFIILKARAVDAKEASTDANDGSNPADDGDIGTLTARNERNDRTAEYLLGLPLLGDYLEDGLAQVGEGISDDNAVASVGALVFWTVRVRHNPRKADQVGCWG